MGTASYAYNEEKMMAGIQQFIGENKPQLVKQEPSKPPRPPKPPQPQISMDIVNRVAEKFAVTPEAILSKLRDAHLVRAREIIVLILRREYGYSLQRVGGFLGRHHTSIMYAERMASRHYETIPTFHALVDSLSKLGLSIKRNEIGLPL